MIDKELQDHVWNHCLPKEFREAVKRVANNFSRRTSGILGRERTLAETFLNEFIDLFGRHNLTSDAEGEEMLTVSRKRVQGLYTLYQTYKQEERPIVEDGYYDGEMNALKMLFGSKCLPDESNLSEKLTSSESKPAEPKLNRGQKCKIIGGKGTKGLIGQIVTLTSFVPEENAWAVMLPDMNFIYLTESDLEPHTEPKEKNHIAQDLEMVDNIIKDGFAKERRLNIAAKMLQALVCAPVISGVDPNPPAEQLAQTAFRLADALIAECEEGGMK